MHFTTSTLLAVLAATTTEAYSANKRTFAVNRFYGKGPLLTARVDPLTNPGTASGHVHAIQGGNAFAMTMSDNQALGSTCTSSNVKADKSNYWTPSLYFKDPKTGQLESVEMFYMNVYYFFDATTDKIQAFPPGLRMLVGNPNQRTPPATGGKPILDKKDGAISAISWTCPRDNPSTPLYPADSDGLHGVGIQDPGNKGSGVGFPDKNCDGYASPLRADIHFPSCYNPAAGLTDYKNNMDYPTNGVCPQGWIHVPHMFYEVYWNTPKFASRWTQGQGSQPFVLSNGDPTGYGLHGDFISGWDVAPLQQIIDNCDAGSAGMDKCPGLMGGLNDPGDSCNIQSPVAETVIGVMNALPGGNAIGEWGKAVAGAPAASAAPAPVKTNAPAAGTTAKAPATPTSKKADNDDDDAYPAPKTVSVIPIEAATQVAEDPAPAVTQAPNVGDAPKNTMVTSYVSETTVVFTTVTADGPAPTDAPTTDGNGTQVAGWTYTGCFVDQRKGDRVLSGIKFANVGAASNTVCTAYCDARGYSMAGTEFGGQCFCGNELVGSSAADEGECDMECEGDKSETCGGSLRLSVYSKGAKKERRHRHLHRHLLNLS